MNAAESHGLDIDEMVYALDSTTIDLCLSMFPWAIFRHRLVDKIAAIHPAIEMTYSSPFEDNIPRRIRVLPLQLVNLESRSYFNVDPDQPKPAE